MLKGLKKLLKYYQKRLKLKQFHFEMNLFTYLAIFSILFLKLKGEDERVQVLVYYEALCPDSASFINGELKRVYSLIPHIVNIKLIPFGKASVSK